MAYAIGLTLDRMLADEVRRVWREFETAGVGKTPGQLGGPSHITFSVFPSGNAATLIQLIEETPVDDTRLRLIPFGTFLGEKHVLYYNAVLSGGLQSAHKKHCEIIRALNIGHNQMYLPENILFHCTIAMEIEDGDLYRGINICVRNRQVLEGRAERIELIEFFPLQPIYRRNLATVKIDEGTADRLLVESTRQLSRQRISRGYGGFMPTGG